ncbi:hypothetical protein KI387_010958, partial [Taxus chinensis]
IKTDRDADTSLSRRSEASSSVSRTVAYSFFEILAPEPFIQLFLKGKYPFTVTTTCSVSTVWYR